MSNFATPANPSLIIFFHILSFSFIFLHFSFIFLHFLSFSFMFLHSLSFSFIFFHFFRSLSFSFILFHFLSFSFVLFHFLSFSFVLFHDLHFLSFSCIFSFFFFHFLFVSFFCAQEECLCLTIHIATALHLFSSCTLDVTLTAMTRMHPLIHVCAQPIVWFERKRKLRAGHRAETLQTLKRSAVEFFSSDPCCGAR